MLSRADTEHIAKLAKLNLTESEIEKFSKQLSEILDYVKKLESVDTSNVAPTKHALKSVKNHFQGESKSNTLNREQVLRNAKESRDGYILTEAVL